MKTIFIKEECILIKTWSESKIFENGEIKDVICCCYITNETVLKSDIIHFAFESKKWLDKRDSFIIIK